jgi:hypothetical protein
LKNTFSCFKFLDRYSNQGLRNNKPWKLVTILRNSKKLSTKPSKFPGLQNHKTLPKSLTKTTKKSLINLSTLSHPQIYANNLSNTMLENPDYLDKLKNYNNVYFSLQFLTNPIFFGKIQIDIIHPHISRFNLHFFLYNITKKYIKNKYSLNCWI